MEPINLNNAVLPDALESFVKKFHLARILSGTLVFILGAASIGYYKSFGYNPVMTAGIAAALSGGCGIAATLHRSFVLHAACVATSAITLSLGFTAYALCNAESSYYHSGDEKGALLLCNTLALVVDQVIAASAVGLQAAVLYITKRLQG